jgi:hypothetical protein
MKATIVFLARDRTAAWQHAHAGLYGIGGIQPIESYDAVAVVPLHDTDDYNVLLAEVEATCMSRKFGDAPRHMVPGDLVVFSTGHVFLADVPDKWTSLDDEHATPFIELVNRSLGP